MPPSEEESKPVDLPGVREPVDSRSPLKQIRTFQGDVAHALENQKASLVSIQQRGAKARQEALSSDDGSRSRRVKAVLLLLGSLVLLAIGSAGGWYAYKEYKNRTAPAGLTELPNRFIPVQREIDVDTESLTRERLLYALHLDELEEIERGDVAQVTLYKPEPEGKRHFTTDEFFSILNVQAPKSLLRAFDPLFMLGFLGEPRTLLIENVPEPTAATSTASTTPENKISIDLPTSTFLIVKVSSFENAFAGMLDWEKDLLADLGPLFTTAPFLRDIASSSVFFRDVAINNNDARVVRLPGGEAVFAYSFLDDNKLIISDSLETVKILIGRLNREKLVR